MAELPPLLLVSVGNTRTRFAHTAGDSLEPSACIPTVESPRLLDEIVSAAKAAAGSSDRPRVVLASVNDPAAQTIEDGLKRAGVGPVIRLGRDLPIPIEHSLEHPVRVGQDRLLDALGAYSRSEQACVVVDAGTAITVDFVDGAGVFHGGAIGPGLRMMLSALHDKTAALPAVEVTPDLLPGDGQPPFGRTTSQAMAVGVVSALRGMAHDLIDRYAEFYEAYPRVVATGGDAPLLFDGDPLVEAIVPDLTLIGMLAACRIALSAESDGADESENEADGSDGLRS